MNDLIARAFADMPADAWPLPVGRAVASVLWKDHGNASLAVGAMAGALGMTVLVVLVLIHASITSKRR